MPYVDSKTRLVGFINTQGKVAIPALFGGLEEPFKNGKAKVTTEQKFKENDPFGDEWESDDGWGTSEEFWIDKTGKKIR